MSKPSPEYLWAANVRNKSPVLGLNAGRLAPFPYVVEMMEPLAETVEGQALDSGHWIPESRPEELAALLADFFSRH